MDSTEHPRSIDTSAIVVTGANGFLGSHFTERLAERGDLALYALVRGNTHAERAKRMTAALRTAAEACGRSPRDSYPGVHVIGGDVRHPDCGIDADTLDRLRSARVSQVWHFASDLRFEEGLKQEIFENNVAGARNALALARTLGAHLVYISTAYTAGRVEGDVPEELHALEGPFNNSYEASKCAAEHLLIDESNADGVRLTIMRPSIVVGPENTRRSDGSSTGLYGFVRAVGQLHSHLANYDGLLRLAATPSAEINFVPVDRVVEDMLHLMDTDFGDQQIYHLTSVSSVTAEECWDALSASFDLRNVVLQPRGTFNGNSIERLLERRIGFFISYINSHKRFRRRLPDGPVVDARGFARYVEESVELGRETTKAAELTPG